MDCHITPHQIGQSAIIHEKETRMLITHRSIVGNYAKYITDFDKIDGLEDRLSVVKSMMQSHYPQEPRFDGLSSDRVVFEVTIDAIKKVLTKISYQFVDEDSCAILLAGNDGIDPDALTDAVLGGILSEEIINLWNNIKFMRDI